MGVELSSKTYLGKFVKGRKEVVVRTDLTTSPLRCRDFFTPTFAWGYHGGAPDNLAIAILEDHFGLKGAAVDARVIRLFSAFADDMVSNFGHDDAWSLTSGRVAKWVRDHEKVPSRPPETQAVFEPQAVGAAYVQPEAEVLAGPDLSFEPEGSLEPQAIY